jgi:raffinose/stachyose/melibiose transport system permease protein
MITEEVLPTDAVTTQEIDRPAPARGASLRQPRRSIRRAATRALVWFPLAFGTLVMLVPLYILVVNAFKDDQDIEASPLGLPIDRLTFTHLENALHSPDFNVVRAYGLSLLFVVLVNALSLLVAAPVSYVIARGNSKFHVFLLMFFVAGQFIPSQVMVIPVVYVLKTLGLMGTIPGFVLFETTLTLPFTIFVLSAYIRTIPSELDQAAAVDGAGRMRTFWSVIFPLMIPAVATVVILNGLSVWNDFVNPQIILGPASGLYTVTTGVYAAIGQYTTNYNVVFPNLLLAIAPAIAFFLVMQRYIVGGLTAGATKG